MRNSRAVILQNHEDAARIVASSARISTQSGNAMEIYNRSGDREKDLKLIGKVLSSGHKSVIEHQFFSIAFNDVSVMAEQYIIEFRLASYTVKSRRYVNFSDAGYVVPEGMNDDVRGIYENACRELFACYDRLIEAGIPKEDARFVLPYGFRSNFFMTVNAREMLNLIDSMLNGRGSVYPELKSLGMQLKEQFDSIYPGVADKNIASSPYVKSGRTIGQVCKGTDAAATAELFSQPADAKAVLERALRFEDADMDMRELVRSKRPRALETLNYAFEIDNVSLACVTHFTRHRMLSLQIRHEAFALQRGNYVLPESIKADAAVEAIYREAFARQADAANKAIAAGAGEADIVYFAMAGHTTDISLSFNAREAAHFARLRTCTRAQWEIRAIARDMVKALAGTELHELFRYYGPSCAMDGKCPEGKMTCGKPVKIEDM